MKRTSRQREASNTISCPKKRQLDSSNSSSNQSISFTHPLSLYMLYTCPKKKKPLH